MPASTDADRGLSEPERVTRWRYAEARLVGLGRRDARMYAESDIDCERLRTLVRFKATPEQIVRILL